MSKESIVQRIISDAEKEAEDILSAAHSRATQALEEADKEAARRLAGVNAETAQKVKSILDGKAATARLDGAKVELAEKRRVIDSVYREALNALISLDKKSSLSLAERLLEAYAENGDEIVFSTDYKYATEVAALGVVKEKKLTTSKKGSGFDGGFILRGKNSDKDLSYGALLAADREEHQAEIAASIFKD